MEGKAKRDAGAENRHKATQTRQLLDAGDAHTPTLVRPALRAPRDHLGRLHRCELSSARGELIVAAWSRIVREAQLNNRCDGKLTLPPRLPAFLEHTGKFWRRQQIIV